jgi:hypothetical protein
MESVGINSQEASALIVVTQHYDTLQARQIPIQI